MGDNELTSLPLWPHGLESESEREQRNSGWSRSAHTPIKRISEHRDTISCHPLCCTNDLIDMKGRCCPKIVVSIPRSLFTSGQLRHIGGTVPKTALPLWRKVCEKREVDIISRYKWWINEELHRWSFDKPLKKFGAVLLTGLKWLRSNLSTTRYDLTPTDQRGKLYEKIFFTLDFHILPEHRRIGDNFFPCRCISIKNGYHPRGRCWPIYLESKPSLNCWIAVEKAEITFISIHINANQNSYHDDKSIL